MSNHTGGSGYQCASCGAWVYYNTSHTCKPLSAPWTPVPVQPQGWKCPNCGKAHAPSVLTCPVIGAPTWGLWW